MQLFGHDIERYLFALLISWPYFYAVVLPKRIYGCAIKNPKDSGGAYACYCGMFAPNGHGYSFGVEGWWLSKLTLIFHFVFFIASLPLIAWYRGESFEYHPMLIIFPICWLVGILVTRSHFYYMSVLREREGITVGSHFVQRIKDFMLISWITWAGLLCAWLVPTVQEWLHEAHQVLLLSHNKYHFSCANEYV